MKIARQTSDGQDKPANAEPIKLPHRNRGQAKVQQWRRRGQLVFEVALIAVGVFPALWANNWHENREHRAQAQAALRNFAGEMELNR